MKYLLSLILLVCMQYASAGLSHTYKVHIVTWTNDRVTGKIESIADSSISIRINTGKIFTFSAVQIKNLKIWRPGINLPATIAGALSGVLIIRQLASQDDEWGLADAIAVIIGLPFGSVAGLAIGDLISTRFNKRRMHSTDFKFLRNKLMKTE